MVGLLDDHFLQEREDVAVCFLHGGFTVMGRHATLEARIGSDLLPGNPSTW
jgi:hypothetical protein